MSEDKPGIGGELLLGQKMKPKYSVFPKEMGTGLPSWVAFDKQVSHVTLGDVQPENNYMY